MFTLLRQRNFALLWFGGLISLTGSWVLQVALPFYVYQMTGSSLAAGMMAIVHTLPAIGLGSLAGVLVDRWDRKRTMVIANGLQGLLLLLLLIVLHLTQQVWIVYGVAFAATAIAQFFAPAENALLPPFGDGRPPGHSQRPQCAKQ